MIGLPNSLGHVMNRQDSLSGHTRFLPADLDNIWSAILLLDRFRGNPRAIAQVLAFRGNGHDMAKYPAGGYPDLCAQPAVERGGKPSVLTCIAGRVLDGCHQGKSAEQIMREMGSGDRAETIYHIEYDRTVDDGWVVLRLPGTPDIALNENKPSKTWQWKFSFIILPLRPIYNAIALQGSSDIDRLRSLEMVSKRVIGSHRLRQRIIMDIAERRRSRIEAVYTEAESAERKRMSGEVEADVMSQTDKGATIADELEFYHYPFPLCELPHMHPKVGWQRGEAFDTHHKRVISNRRFIIALKIVDRLVLTIEERREASCDWEKFRGAGQEVPVSGTFGSDGATMSSDQITRLHAKLHDNLKETDTVDGHCDVQSPSGAQ